jgi:hypothetical protein
MHVKFVPGGAGNLLINSPLAWRLSQWNRLRKVQCFQRLLHEKHARTVLDVGAGMEWNGARNTLHGLFSSGKLPIDRLVATGLEELTPLSEKYRGIEFVQGNGLSLPFADKSFDMAYSNAVIEHVLGENARRQLISEMLRVAWSCFVTTPNLYFPIEVHSRLPFLHWLPDHWFNWTTKRLGIGFISKGMGGYFVPIGPNQLRSYFPNGEQVRISLGWLGMTLIAVYSQK